MYCIGWRKDKWNIIIYAIIFPKLHVQTSPNLLCMLPAPVSSTGGVAIAVGLCYVTSGLVDDVILT